MRPSPALAGASEEGEYAVTRSPSYAYRTTADAVTSGHASCTLLTCEQDAKPVRCAGDTVPRGSAWRDVVGYDFTHPYRLPDKSGR